MRMIKFMSSMIVKQLKQISDNSICYQSKLIIFDENQMDLKVIEPIKSYLKEFSSPVEFNLWYAKNKDEVDKQTTHKLNKMYHIIGYRITKIKGELMLKEDHKVKDKSINDEIHEDINEIREEIKNIKDTVNKLIEFINKTFQGTTDVSPPSVT